MRVTKAFDCQENHCFPQGNSQKNAAWERSGLSCRSRVVLYSTWLVRDERTFDPTGSGLGSVRKVWRMHVSSDDAAVMYARACRAWYGQRALRVVTNKMQELGQRGDAGGVVAWAKVAIALSQARKSQDERRGDGERGKLY